MAAVFCLSLTVCGGSDDAAGDDGLIFPAGWIPEQPYDPADNWGEDWMDNWD